MTDLIIEHPDGRRYGTTDKGWAKLKSTDYAGFKIVGEETPADFVVTGVPAPRKARSHARKKAAAPIAPPAAEASDETE